MSYVVRTLLIFVIIALVSTGVGVDFLRGAEPAVAEELSSEDVLYRQASEAIDHSNWSIANRCLEALLSVTPEGPEREALSSRYQTCVNNAALLDRYWDGSMSAYIRSSRVDDGRRMLTETIRLIQKHCCLDVQWGRVLSEATDQMRQSLENEEVLRQYGGAGEALKSLRKALADQVEHFTGVEVSKPELKVLFEFCDALRGPSERSGFGEGWPEIELSCSIVSRLDRYSRVQSPTRTKDFYRRINGNYRGLGVDLLYGGKCPSVFDVVSSSPAEQAGILPGDRILSIFNTETTYMPSTRVNALLRSDSGQGVELICDREGRRLRFVLNARPIYSPSVRYVQLMGEEDRIGYFRLSAFDRDTAMEIRRSLDTLIRQGAQSVIIDLRDNGGGIFSSGMDSAGIFLREGSGISLFSSDSVRRYNVESYGWETYTIPLVLLVNETTASAAEIFSGILQQNHRAEIIGSKTLGKGCVQTIYGMTGLPFAFSLTTSRWQLSEAVGEEFGGIEPDIRVDSACDSDPYRSMRSYLSQDNGALRRAILFLKHHL